jgi:hypothetical protein
LATGLAAPVRAGPSVEEDLAAATRLVKAEKWKEALEAYAALFADHAGAPEIVARIQGIEEDIRQASFRSQVPDPTPKELLGHHVKKFDPRSLRISLAFPAGPDRPEFSGKIRDGACLQIRLDGDVAVEFSGSYVGDDRKTVVGLGVALCLEAETNSCYLVKPGFRWQPLRILSSPPETLVYEDEACIVRHQGSESRDLYRKMHGQTVEIAAARYRISRRGSEISAFVDRKKVASASDGRLRGGFLAITAGEVWNLTIEATVERTWYQTRLGEFRTESYRKWIETPWRPDAVIPAWARGGPARSAAPEEAALPATAAGPPGKGLADALAAWFAGKEAEFVEQAANLRDLEPGTRAYVDGLMALSLGRVEEAERLLGGLIGTDPQFGPAWVYRALARFRLRDLEGARTDLAAATGKCPRFPDLFLVEALLAFYDGDLPAAEKTLGAARAAGTTNPRLEELAALIHRAARGPQWPKRFEAANRNCRVASDVSREICAEVANLLDRAFLALTGQFPKTRRPTAPLRVYVFSSREGFLAYAGDLGRDLGSAAGAYVPQLGEMVLFVPAEDRSLLWRTAKHEAFHAFIHEAVDQVPIWFDEGWAQWFERLREVDGRLCPGEVDPEELTPLSGDVGPATVPLTDFLRLDHVAFMKDAARNYAQALAFVRFLEEAEDPGLRLLLDGYFRALKGGLSPEDAVQKVFAASLADVERRFLAYLDRTLRGGTR